MKSKISKSYLTEEDYERYTLEELEDILTDRQRRFAIEYIIDFNGTRAAIAAGYSKKTAYSIANENLRKPELQEYLKRKNAKIENRLENKKIKIMEKLEALAFNNLFDVIEFDPKKGIIVEDLKKLPPLIQQNIQSIKQVEKEVTDREGNITVTRFFEIKLKDSIRPLIQLAEHYGIGKYDSTENPESDRRPRIFVVPAFKGYVDVPEEAKILAESYKSNLEGQN